MCKDQQNSLKTIVNFCDMLKRKVGYIAILIKENQTPQKILDKMNKECKRMLHYGLII